MGRLRVIMLASFFPKPGKLMMGSWALSQAQALNRNGIDFKVVSPTPWIPRFFRRFERFRSWAECPADYNWGDLNVVYPKWALYQLPVLRRWDFKWPAFQHAIAWHSASRRFRDIIREFKPDILYAHHSWNCGDVARRLKKEFGIPIVITDHDFEEITECERLPARRKYMARIFANTDLAAPVAKRMTRDIERLFPGVPTCVAHNGTEPIPSTLFKIPRPPELVGKKVLFAAGNFFERKGFPLLIRAFARVAANHPEAVLRIAGSGQEQGLIETEIRRSGLSGRVRMLGGLPKEVVMQEMVWCDVFTLLGWSEPFATVYLEAFSAGKPVICCNDGGINDVLINGVHGIAVPPRDEIAAANALDQLLGDDQARNRMAAAAFHLFNTSLTNDGRAHALITAFQTIVDRKRRTEVGLA